MKDDGPSYTYDGQGNLNTASRTAEKQSFHYGEDNRLQRLAQMDGTAFEYAYDSQKLLNYAKSTEGVRSNYIYNDKGLPVTAYVQADKMSASVTVGRKYFIRQKKSGKYLDTHQGDVNGSNIHQYQFNGSVDQTNIERMNHSSREKLVFSSYAAPKP